MNKNKIAIAIALILMLTMAVSLVALPVLNSAQALNVEDFGATMHAYIVVAPNPVGVGQSAAIIAGFTFPTVSWFCRCYSGWTVTVTSPEGTTQTLGPFTSDATGSFSLLFTPDTVGVWTFQAHYPGGYADFNDAMNVSVPAADSNLFSLTVQEDPLPWVGEHYVPPTSLPTEYWNFPIYGEHRDWQAIAGNWLMPSYGSGATFGNIKSAYAPYTTVTDTGHIVWTKPNLLGGIVGDTIDMTYYTGSIYRGELQPPVVMNGRLYYRQMELPRQGFYCVDTHTGETIWYVNATYPDGRGGMVKGADAQITLGQILALKTMNWHGGIPYLWSTAAPTWAVWDPWTGELIYTIVNAPAPVDLPATSGLTFVRDPSDGTLLYYRYDAATKTLVKWNSTKMMDTELQLMGGLIGGGVATMNFPWARPKYNLDWRSGIEWNVTSPVTFSSFGGAAPIEAIFDPNDPSIIILTNQTRGLIKSATAFEHVAISAEDGRVLWRRVRDEGTWESSSGGSVMSMEDDVYTVFRKETRQIYAYRASTGKELWVSDPYPNQWAMYLSGSIIAYDKLYVTGYDGKVWAHDVQTGKVVWEWGPVNAGLETPYGHHPFYGGVLAVDNKIIVVNDEHSQSAPLYRGHRMYVIDAESGQTLWDISGVYTSPIAANGYVLAPNGYDGKLYAFGKGPTAATVSIQNDVTTHGNKVLVKGSVTDISPGTRQNEQALRFPNGVPAVSDESQSAWMEYVYMQKPKPTDVTGVVVELFVIDANNNYRSIGTTTTTDATGFYSYQWTPDIPGKYTVIASFAGSESYWPSQAETALYVEETPAVVEPTPSPAPMTDTIVTGFGIAMIIAIVAIGLVIILMLRKKE